MKFMQRAAASSPLAQGSPSSQPGTPASNKRQRTDENASPTPFNVNELADQRAVEKAMAEEEAKRQAALDRAAQEAGDTRWVLNFEDKDAQEKKTGGLRVQMASFATLDRGAARIELDVEEDKPVAGGRRSFGKFNKKLEVFYGCRWWLMVAANDMQKLQDPEYKSDSESSEDEDEEEEDDSDMDSDDPASQIIREQRQEAARQLKEERRAKRRAEKKELERLASFRKKKEVNLNSLSSISGTGGGGGKGNVGPCHNCGQEGHMMRDCKKKRSRKSEADHYGDRGDGGRNAKKSRKSY